jgi:hypothetical protein
VSFRLNAFNLVADHRQTVLAFLLESDTYGFQCSATRGLTGRRFGSRISGNAGTWSLTGTRWFVVRLGILIAV